MDAPSRRRPRSRRGLERNPLRQRRRPVRQLRYAPDGPPASTRGSPPARAARRRRAARPVRRRSAAATSISIARRAEPPNVSTKPAGGKLLSPAPGGVASRAITSSKRLRGSREVAGGERAVPAAEGAVGRGRAHPVAEPPCRLEGLARRRVSRCWRRRAPAAASSSVAAASSGPELASARCHARRSRATGSADRRRRRGMGSMCGPARRARRQPGRRPRATSGWEKVVRVGPDVRSPRPARPARGQLIVSPSAARAAGEEARPRRRRRCHTRSGAAGRVRKRPRGVAAGRPRGRAPPGAARAAARRPASWSVVEGAGELDQRQRVALGPGHERRQHRRGGG